ncbi:MAG: hypothetical protein JNJ71_13210 [Rubrivivax sp.]|nr:hypothetical protein [Rubrivivax sp.]
MSAPLQQKPEGDGAFRARVVQHARQVLDHFAIPHGNGRVRHPVGIAWTQKRAVVIALFIQRSLTRVSHFAAVPALQLVDCDAAKKRLRRAAIRLDAPQKPFDRRLHDVLDVYLASTRAAAVSAEQGRDMAEHRGCGDLVLVKLGLRVPQGEQALEKIAAVQERLQVAIDLGQRLQGGCLSTTELQGLDRPDAGCHARSCGVCCVGVEGTTAL